MGNAFDEFTPNTANAFDEYTPATNEALATPTATEVLNEPKSAFQQFTSPTEPRNFNMGNVAADVALGAGTGAILGSPTWVGTVPAAVLGGTLGLTGGIAGEIARSQGKSPATALFAETVASLGTQGALSGIKSMAKLLPWKGRVLSGLIPDNIEQRASQVVGQRMFGKDTYDVLYTTENSEAAQTALKQQLFGNNLSVLGQRIDTKASDILRSDFYDNLKNLKSQVRVIKETIPAKFDIFGMQQTKKMVNKTEIPNVFATSPEYKVLMDDVNALIERGLMTPAEAGNLKKTLFSETSTNPKVAPFASKDVLNLVQNGGVYTVAKKGAELETKTKIPESARNALKLRFDEYLERNLGQKQYSILKNAERQEFIAEARDAIPTLINEGFKFGSPEFTKVINLVKQSPEGKNDLLAGFNQFIKNQSDPDKMVSEFRRIAPGLRELGVIDREASANILQKVLSFPKNVDKAVRIRNVKNMLLFPAVSTINAEGVNQISGALNPFTF
jgi:hypothetical protein